MVKNAFIVKVIGILCDMEDIQAKEDLLQAKWEEEILESINAKKINTINMKVLLEFKKSLKNRLLICTVLSFQRTLSH